MFFTRANARWTALGRNGSGSPEEAHRQAQGSIGPVAWKQARGCTAPTMEEGLEAPLSESAAKAVERGEGQRDASVARWPQREDGTAKAVLDARWERVRRQGLR